MLEDILRTKTIPKLNKIEPRVELAFKAYIREGAFKFEKDIDSSKSFEIRVDFEERLLKSIAYDIDRFGSSAFESIHGIQPENKINKKTVSWLAIRSYYAAYYAAHSLLRMFGVMCCQLNSTELKVIQDVANMFGHRNGKTLKGGYYACKYQPRSETLVFKHLSNSHKDVWKEFMKVLETLEDVASGDFPEAEKRVVIDFIFNLRERLKRNGNISGTWLSEFRNKVNYSHSYGVWYPYHQSTGKPDKMYSLVDTWKNELDYFLEQPQENDDKLVFIQTCSMILAFCRIMILDLDNISSNSFLKNGGIKLLKLFKAA